MTDTTARDVDTHSEEPPPTPTGHSTGLWIAVAVLGLAVIALVVWVMVERGSGTDSAVPEDIEALIDDYLTAWEQQDEQAMRNLVTLDFVVNEYYYEDSIDRTFRTEVISDDLDGVLNVGFSPSRQWTTEQVGESVIAGDGPWFVAVGENWILDTWRADGMAHYVIVRDGDELRIANHYWAGESYLTE